MPAQTRKSKLSTRPANPPSAATDLAYFPLPRRTFSSEHQRTNAERAEAQTGLKARELFRPAWKTEIGLDITPDDERYRCQLGRVHDEIRELPAQDGICDAFRGKVALFEIVSCAPTFAEATAIARRILSL